MNLPNRNFVPWHERGRLVIEAGFCRRDITPPLGVLMGGHPGTKRSEGVLDPLYCRAALIQNGETTLAFLSADLLFLDGATVSAARKEISRALGIPPERIFLNATHTHSGPLTTDLFGASVERDYVETLPAVFAAACLGARENAQPARLGMGKTRVPGIAFNARFLMKDGSIETHPRKGNPEIVEAEGPVDDELSVLHVADAEGRLLGALVNFANHPQCLERRSTLFSADFPGRIEKYVRQKTAPNAVVLFGNGPSGNLCPVNAQNPATVEVGEAWLDRIGRILADHGERLLEKTLLEAEVPLRIATRRLEIPLRPIPETRVADAKRFLAETRAENVETATLSDYGTEPSPCDKLSVRQFLETPFWKRQACEDLLALVEERAESAFESCEIAVVALGNAAVVMVPFELFVEFGLEIKEKSPFENTMIIELANGYSGYVPTRAAFSRTGGYETLTLRSSKLAPEAGETTVSEVLAMCDALSKELKYSRRGIKP